MQPRVLKVTNRIIERSRASRQAYLARMAALGDQEPHRGTLSCGNLAHGFAACQQGDKDTLKLMNQANVAMVSAYNDMLSAHQPYHRFPTSFAKRPTAWVQLPSLPAAPRPCAMGSLRVSRAWSSVCSPATPSP